MPYFAEIKDSVVVRVIVADQKFIDSGAVGDPANWIETDPDTSQGAKTAGTPLRKNYAGIGYKYDPKADAFIPPQPFPSWSLDELKAIYVAPKPMPEAQKGQMI